MPMPWQRFLRNIDIMCEASCERERRGSPVVRTLAYQAAGPGSIPGLGGKNY